MTKPAGGRGGGTGGGRRPPKEHQWTKGKSGNPKGRPRKAPAEPLDGDIAQMILAEGFKPISVTEGGKPVSMPAVQAVFRAMLLAALKGNSHAGRSYVQHFAQAQAQQQNRKDEEIRIALKLKMQLECARIEFVAGGGDEIEMALHPSDIEIDFDKGEVKNFLGLTGDDRKARARAVEHRDYLLEQIERSLGAAAEDGDDALLQMSRDAARAAVQTLNEGLPSRFRRMPPGDKPTLGPESEPEELWRALLQPTKDRLTSMVPGNGGETDDSDRPSAAAECDASRERPRDDTTGDNDSPASPHDDEGGPVDR